MCRPKTPDVEVPEPRILTNPLTDHRRGAVGDALAARTGRSSLRIPLEAGSRLGFGGAPGASRRTPTSGPAGNGRAAPARASLSIPTGGS